jgi:hypothetical protein
LDRLSVFTHRNLNVWYLKKLQKKRKKEAKGRTNGAVCQKRLANSIFPSCKGSGSCLAAAATMPWRTEAEEEASCPSRPASPSLCGIARVPARHQDGRCRRYRCWKASLAAHAGEPGEEGRDTSAHVRTRRLQCPDEERVMVSKPAGHSTRALPSTTRGTETLSARANLWFRCGRA